MKDRKLLLLIVLISSCLVQAFPSLLDGSSASLRLRRFDRLRGGALSVATHPVSTARQAKSDAKFKNFEEMLSNFPETPVLVSFHTKLCGPCRLMQAELRDFSDKCGDDVKMFAVDTEKWPKLAARYQVTGLPTLIFFKGGKIITRIEKVEKADELLKRVKTFVE